MNDRASVSMFPHLAAVRAIERDEVSADNAELASRRTGLSVFLLAKGRLGIIMDVLIG
jgi:hypothetical protein